MKKFVATVLLIPICSLPVGAAYSTGAPDGTIVIAAISAPTATALPKTPARAGAFYIWADVGHLTDDSLSFCKQLLRDAGVATAPGVDFDPEEGRHFIRFSFAVSTREVEEAIRRMTPWLAQQANQRAPR